MSFQPLGDNIYRVSGAQRSALTNRYIPKQEALGIQVMIARVEQLDAEEARMSKIKDHVYLPVAGHPDDPECTYREDGTDATYCGAFKWEHKHVDE